VRAWCYRNTPHDKMSDFWWRTLRGARSYGAGMSPRVTSSE
jgi:hypothetical protein